MAIELLFERIPSKEEVREAMASKIGDSPIPSWTLGRGYSILQDRGYRQTDIAKAVGKSQGHVSMCVAVFMGLSERAHDTIGRLGSAGPDLPGLVRIARLQREAQMDAIERLVRKRKIPRDFNLEQTVFRQFLKLRELNVSVEAKPHVDAVLAYLSGGPWPSTTGTLPARPHGTSRTRSTGSTDRRTRSGSSTRAGSRRN